MKSKLLNFITVIAISFFIFPIIGQSTANAAGITWAGASFPNARTPYSIEYANNLFVAAPWDKSATYVLTSKDG
jgi:hypothetical protein